jgi:hypothetical protein
MDAVGGHPTTSTNRAFVAEMLGSKKRLEDYPERVDRGLIVHEPASLPFGGTYEGLSEFTAFYGQVRNFYDFDTWRLIDVTGDEKIVFATSEVRVAGSDTTMHIAERFTFRGPRLIEVRVFICDEPNGRGTGA